MHVVGHHHGRVHGLVQLRDQGLQRVGLDRQPEPGELRQDRGVPGPAEPDLAGVDPPAGRLHGHHPVAVLDEAGDLAVLDDVHAHLVALAGEGPGHVVVLGDARARLVGRPHHRVADVVPDVDDRAQLLDLLRADPLRVDAVELVRVDPAHRLADVPQGVRQVHHAALGEQEVVLQLLGQDLPELQGVLVHRRGLVPQVVGADDRGVAGHVPAGQPAPLQHGDVGHAVVLGQVVGGRQPVSAAADDHGVVGGLRVRVAPQEVRVLRQQVGHQKAPFRAGADRFG